MFKTKEEMIAMGWESIGFDGSLEYLAREDEYGSVQFIPVAHGNTIGMVQTQRKEIIELLSHYISK